MDVDFRKATVAGSPVSSAGMDAPGVDAPTKPGDMIHFSLNDNVQVSVPAERLDAVRCILQWSQDREAVSTNEPNRSSRFQRVITCTD